jgi:hypothetical protein
MFGQKKFVEVQKIGTDVPEFRDGLTQNVLGSFEHCFDHWDILSMGCFDRGKKCLRDASLRKSRGRTVTSALCSGTHGEGTFYSMCNILSSGFAVV